MIKLEKKYIFIDVDGTLFEHGYDVPKSAIKAIKEARKNGHKVFLCTGRNKASIQKFLPIGFDGFICSAGSYIETDNHILIDESMNEKTILELTEIAKRYHIYYSLETTHITYQQPEITQLFALGTTYDQLNSEMARIIENRKDEMKAKDLEDYQGEPIHKFVFIGKSKEGVKLLKDYCKERLRFILFDEIISNDMINGEINDFTVSKGLGIQKIMDYYHVPLEATIGFGDSMNDLEMIKTVHIGIVMENGSEKLKRYADTLTESPLHNGIYNEFVRQGLIKA